MKTLISIFFRPNPPETDALNEFYLKKESQMYLPYHGSGLSFLLYIAEHSFKLQTYMQLLYCTLCVYENSEK